MAIYVDREGIDQCISKIQNAIEELDRAAATINSSMDELKAYWQGVAADKAQGTYESDYKKLLTQTVPTSVDEFKQYINSCKQSIIDVDTGLAGG